jgi:TonB-linked SusC/RagA family outer membrane protein
MFAMFLVAAIGIASAQGRTVKGSVVDGFGDPIIGANVLVVGTTNGAISDLDGNFTLQNVAQNAKLQVSYIGYLTQTVAVNGQSSIKITLKEDSKALDEVVVVGYGTMKKSDLTGAMARVSSKQIEERSVQNALQAMQGKAAGVDVASNNRPGELAEIRVRGNRSLLADNDPLYVIDGIPMTAGSMADVNPNDIESMEVLKDASATAIYGSRGANGVVLITTKKGQSGKVSINYDGSVTFSVLNSMTDWMNAGQKLDYNRASAINGGTYNGAYGTAPDPDRDRALWLGSESYMDRVVASAYQLNSDGTPVLRASTAEERAMGYADQVPVYDSSKMLSTDWGDLVTRTGVSQNHQVSLSAGSEKSSLYMSFGYLGQQVPMKDQDYERYTVNINGDITPKDWLKVGIGLNANHSIKNYGIAYNTSNTVAKDSYGLALTMEPWAPAYNEDGSVLITEIGASKENPLRNMDAAYNETRYYSAMLSSYVELDFGKMYQPLSGLKWRTNFGSQYRNSRYGSFYTDEFTNPYGFESTAPGVGYNQQSQNLSWTLENLIYYNKTFAKVHTINLTLMQSAEKYRTEGINIRAYEVVYPTSLWYDLGNSNANKVTYGTSYSAWQRASYMARLNYSLMDKYLLTVTGRYDGASMLAKGNKWDFFPSAALAWKLSEENFMKDLDWLDQLKLRVGYGVTGNSAVSPYSTAGSVTSTFANIPFGIGATGDTTGAKTDVMPNMSLGWEKTASTNIGIDFSVLNNRISGSLEFYKAKTSDLLMNRSIPVITGYGQVKDNVGKTQNKGVELTLTTRNIVTKDFTWTTEWSFSKNSEKIIELADGKTYDSTGPWYVGQPLNIWYDYKYDRIWQNTDEDLRTMALYNAIGKNVFLPGQYKIVDQPLKEVPAGTEGAKTVTIKYTDAAGNAKTETVTYEDNGFGTFNDDDKVIYNKSPKWTGGLNNTFTYKDFSLNIFAYFRMGNYYYGLTQTIGSRVEKDTWSPTNTGAKFAQPTTATRTTTYDGVRNYTKGNMAIIRNISLSYTLPKKALNRFRLSSASVYAQVINPFIFGGELVKAGINPDDITGWTDSSHIGGQTNNTCITRSYVMGVRFGF